MVLSIRSGLLGKKDEYGRKSCNEVRLHIRRELPWVLVKISLHQVEGFESGIEEVEGRSRSRLQAMVGLWRQGSQGSPLTVDRSYS